ncbi:hypothetical protein HK097_006295 [Rhizophlyctis rosea]|uniref:Uncharacterized protein n=1 Tax=Rhizophlyctis rosea TaxID=64517 RepID=A0AAD5X5S5_9FUNG|nr:hypothetical protein HK097_006295 [Rhizophlyctis rosea]
MSGSVPLVITPGKTPNVLLTKDSLEVEPGAYFQQAYSGAEPQSPGHNLAAIVEQNHLAPPELTPSSSASDDIVAETKPDELDKAEDRAALAAIPDSERSTPIPISQTRFSSSPTLLNSPSGLFSDPALLSPAEKSESGGYFGFRKNSVISGLEFAFPSPHEEGTKPTLQDVVRGLSLLEGNAEDLEELNLSYCDACTGDHVKQLARGLQRNTHLKRLALKGVGLGTGAVVDIAQVWRSDKGFEHSPKSLIHIV